MTKILLVDDDAGVRRTLGLHLTRRGHAVRQAVDGKDALEQIEGEPPDLLLTDLVMPEHEGVELITKVRRRWPDLPIIAMSGGGRVNTPGSYLSIAEALGARPLVKPFALAELDEAIEQLCPAAGDRA